MTVSVGRRLGPYEIISAIGAGGMGEVYRARDTKLNREVALKVLPEAFTRDPDRLARFRREALVLASLNHPHIGAIYGLEDSGETHALVLELIEGETLADRIQRGPLPVAEALTIARQIADALDTAHEKGIIHRDLKPANIKITPDGVVKVLDFGLAKAVAGDGSSSGRSESPTVTGGGTREGIILGTAPYMSPDQARGKPVDKGTDIWAFGCVLYEMLTGRVPFPGETMSDTVAAILGREPDWHALPAATPEAIRRLLRRSLQKDDKVRLRDIADARLEIEEARSELLSPAPAATPLRRIERLAWLAAVGVLSLVAVAMAAWAVRPTPPPPEVHLEINTPPVSDPEDLTSLAVSPDGQKLVFVAAVDGQPHLWVRQLDSVVSRPMPGTGDASTPFWSQDSRSVAFYADGALKRIDLAGGLVRTLTAEALIGVGGAWNREGVILLLQNPASPITRISAEGGTPAEVTRLEGSHAGHSFPHFLPDGRHFLYYVTGTPETRGVYVGQLDGPATRKLFEADSAAVYASGHLLFVRGTTLLAQAFDVSRLEVTGSPFPVAEGVIGSMLANVAVALSAAVGGAIAFRVGSAQVERQFVWVDRSGKEIGTVGAPDRYAFAPTISPDGGSLAFLRRVNGNSDVWLLETRRGLLSRFTDHPAEDIFPVWSRDGSRIVFTSNRNGTHDLYQKGTTGVGGEERLLPGAGLEESFACDWSPDGQFLLYQRRSAKTGFDFWALPLRGDGTPLPVIQTQFDERDGQFSPDGKWIAFHSNRSGRFEVYIQPFPGPGTALQVSTSGGAQVRWRPDGRELFYIALDGRLMAAPLQLPADGQLVVGIPVPLFATHVGRVLTIGAQYTVSADGQRFLMNTVVQDDSPTPIRLILNWQPRP